MTADLQVVLCQRQTLTLSALGCARLWLSANDPVNRPKAWEGRAACVACAQGAARAGRPIDTAVQAAEGLRHVCPRCRRVAPRLINGELCVSDFNRAREVVRGRNAKGHPPHLGSLLHAERVAVSEDGEVRQVTHEMLIDRSELLIMEARRARHALAFGVPPARWPGKAVAA